MYQKGILLVLLLQITLGVGFFAATQAVCLEDLQAPVANYTLDERVLADDKVQTLGLIGDLNSEQRIIYCNRLTKDCEGYELLSEKDYDILLRIVEAEAGGEDEKGKVLVANVVLNRVRDDAFPDTVEEVVFQHTDKVYQFSPVKDGRYYTVSVSEDTKQAVNLALSGEDYSGGALYFAARKSASQNSMRWFDNCLTYLFSHGGHEFFR